MEELQLATFAQMKNLYDNYKKSPKDRLTTAYLDTRLEALEGYWSKFQDNHDKIVLANPKSDYFNKNVYDTCQEMYFEMKVRIKEKQSQATTPSSGNSEKVLSDDSLQPVAKLPPISLPKFSGDYREWLSFRDLFKSLVHDNAKLSKVNKCQYLKSSLHGEAETLVKQIPVTETSYDIMWETLNKRYHNRRTIVNAYIGKLLNQKRITTESPKAIKDLLDITSECLISLKAISIPTEHWNDIVVYIIIQKLDPESHKLYEQRIEGQETLPTWADLSKFLELRFRTLEAVKYKDTPALHRNTQHNAKTFSTSLTSSTVNCLFCNGEHRIYNCQDFLKLSVNERQQYVQKNNLCFNCLKKGHAVKECKQTNCRKCNKKHHSLIHGYSIDTHSKETDTHDAPQVNHNTEPTRITLKTHSSRSSPVILATALVAMQSNRTNSIHTLRALVDQGSQATLITEGACQELGLKKFPIQGNIVGINCQPSTIKSLVKLELMSLHNPKTKIKVNAYVLRNLTSLLPQRAQAVDWPQLNSIQLADPLFTQPGRVDLLLGAEVFADIIQQGLMIYRNDTNSLVAQETSLGWVISGSNNKENREHTQAYTHHVKIEIDEELRRFWELEEAVPGKKIMTTDEIKCEKHYSTNHSRKEDGRYEVRLPFAANPPDIGESETIALKRLLGVESKFKRHPELQSRYNEFMTDYLEQNHMQPVSSDKDTKLTCYLPHHAVINEQHLTTKLRVVFDASAKTSNGKSLNDNLLTGPSLQSDIRDITLRWRRHAVVLVGDIRQMYRQILVHESDRQFQRILWRFDTNKPVQKFELTTVTYGTSCAPYLAIKTLKQLAVDEKPNFPEEVTDVLANDFFIDDLLSGASTPTKVIELQENLKKLLKKGGFTLHKWATNILNTEDTTETNRKILGIDWNNRTDTFELQFDIKDTSQKPTKRSILSDIAKLYDPAGWLAPIVIRAKVFLQKLWIEGIDWDDEIPENLEAEWLTFRKHLCEMPKIELDRWIGITDNTTNLEIHGFCDASDIAYSAVVYCRTISPDFIKVTLIEAKTRVAPVKKISTPRLELSGAVLLSKLIDRIRTALNVPLNDTYAWTDATIVLAWLQRPPSYWNTFVANRVTEITNAVDTSRWHHVASPDNPADVASRGVSPLGLQAHALWWNGPSWLREVSALPVKDISEIVNPTELEKRSEVKVLVKSVVVPEPETNKDIISKYSSYKKLLRVISYCLRFYYKCKSKAKKENLPEFVNTTYLNTIELQNSTKVLLKMSQQSEIINKKHVLNLNPIEDKDGLLRVGGRLQNAIVNIETKHPVILAKDSKLAYLIVKDSHYTTLHGGNQLMLNHIRNKYHIIAVKCLIKRVIRECVTCRRHANKTAHQLLGNLPKDRVTPQRCFLVSAVDFAGPVILKLTSGRGSNKTTKAYISVFICMATKAIHLELVSSLSSEGFLAAFRRFTARRGHCKKLISDCGTNFIGASKELKTLSKNSISDLPDELVELLAHDGTAWQFNPPGAPHINGLVEAAVKSTKKHLNRVLGDTKLTYEEYSTLLCQIESCLNSRPLTSLDDDKSGTTIALTPGHFLIGEPPIVVPDENLETQNVPYNNRWIYLQQKLQSFWRQWSQEYLVTLQKRFKWNHKQVNFKPGDIVLVKDDRLPPTKWLMGKVITVHPGSDGLVRVVSLKCKDSIFKRPIHKLCLLPTD